MSEYRVVWRGVFAYSSAALCGHLETGAKHALRVASGLGHARSKRFVLRHQKFTHATGVSAADDDGDDGGGWGKIDPAPITAHSSGAGPKVAL